jgi:hypothetical protein
MVGLNHDLYSPKNWLPMSATRSTKAPLCAQRSTGKSLTSHQFISCCCLVAAAALLMLAAKSPAQGLKNVIPKDQEPVSKIFPPPAVEQSKTGTGKFIIFTREPVGKDWDFVAGAWECIPSRPEIPVTKRAEFCHSSWNCDQLLNVLVLDDSYGMHARFARLQVDTGDREYAVNLYDINYRTWEIRCIWQGSRLSPFGVMGDSILCRSTDGWLLINADSGKLSKEISFTPLETDGGYWLVRRTGEADGCWSYNPMTKEYVAHFRSISEPALGFSQAVLSADGRSRACVLASMPTDWQGGTLAGSLILQRNGDKEDISIPIEMQAIAGSGRPVIPRGVQLRFSQEGQIQFRAAQRNKEAEDRVWSIDIKTGVVSTGVAPHSQSSENARAFLNRVPVPDYLRQDVKGLEHFGGSGLAPAFLMHLGILRERPEYPDCTAGVSRDGRHVLYRAKKGSLAGLYIYGDLLTKQTVRWKSPAGIDCRDSQEFVWVETP